jgi:hypothetical protein
VSELGQHHLVHIAGFNAIKPDKGPHSRLEKAIGIGFKKPAAVILGSSTVYNGMPGVADEEIKEFLPGDAQPIFNAGINGGGIPGVLQYLQHAWINNPRLRLAIIGLEWNHFTRTERASRPSSDEALGDRGVSLESLLRTTLSWSALRDAVSTYEANRDGGWWSDLRRSFTTRRDQAKFYDDHPFVARSRTETINVLFSYWQASHFQERLRERTGQPELDPRGFAYLRQIVDFARAHDIQLEIYVTPHQAAYWSFAKASGTWGWHLEWLRRMAQITPFWDFSKLIDFSYENRQSYFPGDTLHFSSAAGRVLTLKLLQERSRRDTSPWYVTSDNVESRIEQRSESLAAYERADSYLVDLVQHLPLDREIDVNEAVPTEIDAQVPGFRVVHFARGFFAVPAEDRHYDMLRVLKGEVAQEYIADDLDELRKKLPRP